MEIGDIVAVHELSAAGVSRHYTRSQIVSATPKHWVTACGKVFDVATLVESDGCYTMRPWRDRRAQIDGRSSRKERCNHATLILSETQGYYVCKHCSTVPFITVTATHVSLWQWHAARHFALACCLYTVIVMLTLLGVGIAISGIMHHTS